MLTFITSRVSGPLFGGLSVLLLAAIIALGWSNHSLSGKLSDANTAVTNLNRDLAACRLNAARLEGAIATQNSAVDGLKTAGDLAKANAELAAEKAAHTAAAERQTRVTVIEQAKPGDDHCASAKTLIRDTLATEHAK